MTRWIVLNRNNVDLVYFTAGSIGLAIMLPINIYLLKRLINVDFTSKPAKKLN